MTTGQKSLREVAEASRQEKLEADRELSRQQREKSLRATIGRYHDRYRGFGRLAEEGVEVSEPSEEDFEFVNGVRLFSGTIDKGNGWKVIVDDVPFLFGTSHNGESLFVLHTCPKCGVEGGSTFHGLDDLGRLLKFGPVSYSHTCREKEAREVAYAIASAARDLKTSPEDVVNAAFELHGDLIQRLIYR